MTTNEAPLPHTSGVVIVHCGDLAGGRLERRLRSVTASVPAGVRVLATALAPRQLSPSVARLVEVHVVADGAAALIEREVAGEATVVVVPYGVRVSGDWWSELVSRAAALPDSVGVLMVDSAFLFAYPTAVTSLDAPRVALLPVRGISASRRAPTTTARPTVGAVLIVKDEERRLAKCLAALEGVVDEVVVYDTGSRDATLEIARASATTVVEGFWDDDFGAARNRALAHATTDWVLSVDADEVVTADRGQLVDFLAGVGEDLCLVQLVSTTTEDAADGMESRLSRLFRRAKTEWHGALHEQPVALGGGALQMCPWLPPIRVVHSGYAVGHEKTAEKAERNLRISRAAFESASADDPSWTHLAVDYARSQALAGEFHDMLATVALLEDQEMSPAITVQLASSVIPLVMSPEKVDRAQLWTDRAEAAGDSAGATALRRAQLKGLRGDSAGAIADLERLVAQSPEEQGFDIWGKGFDAVSAVMALAQAYSGTGRRSRAAEVLTQLMLDQPDRVPVAELLTAVRSAGTPLTDLAARAPRAFVDRSSFEVPAVAADLALEWYRALLTAHPGDVRILSVGSAAAARTSVDAALEWSVLSREAGHREICALRWLAEGDIAHPRSRTLAWALLVHGLGQSTDGARLDAAADQLDASDTASVLDALRRLLPEVTALRPARTMDTAGAAG